MSIGKLIIYDGDKFNIGHKRSVKEFESFSGVSILEKRITERAKTVGLAREEFEKNEKRKCAFRTDKKYQRRRGRLNVYIRAAEILIFKMMTRLK